jgi:nicotinate-nucleotide adenylyltransferase
MSQGLSAAARRARRVAIFGGSFDPVHAAHIACAKLALEHARVDHIVFVPAARSPLKAQGPTASGPERVAMLETSLRDMPQCSV